MMISDSDETLRDFSQNRSEEAFRALVRQHSPVVYGTALRRLGGDRAAAQDVTQEVFTLLARKAHGLHSVVLGGWLYRQACRRAANHVRSERRRKKREMLAFEAVAASTHDVALDTLLLDDALNALSAKDRDALVLRFFEGKDFKLVGSALGLSEEAARKRVTRALERLGGKLKRKGIAVGAISLGETMTGYGQTQVPVQVASRVAEKALHTGVASGAAPTISLLLPLAAGVLATSLVAGSIRPETVSLAPPAFAALTPAGIAQAKAPESPDEVSLDDMIIGLKRLLSKPSHALTALQTSVLLDSVGVSRIPAFIRLANGRLTAGERASIYQRLLEKWLTADPKGAMDFVLLKNVGKQVDAHSGTNLLNNLFDDWVRNDRGASESWLLDHWEDPVLMEKAFEGSLRNFLLTKLVDERFANEGVASVFKLIQGIPNVEDQAAALGGVTGLNSWEASWQRRNSEKWMEFHQALKAFPHAGLRRELVRNFWTTLSGERSDEVREIQRTAEPLDRFQISLGWLGVKYLRGEMIPELSGRGYTQRFTPVTDQTQREAAALTDGLAAGLAEDQVLGEIGRVLIDVRSSGVCFKWLDARQGEIDVDDALAAKTRKLANASGWSKGQEMIAVDWARRISNDDLRIRLCRGAFRKGLSRSPDAAVAYLESNGLPPDLAAEFRSILNEMP